MRGRPTVFVDLVYEGSTFENLYGVLRRWIDDEHAQAELPGVGERWLRDLQVSLRR